MKSLGKARHKALAMIMSDEESNSSSHDETSSDEDEQNYVAFTLIVEIKSDCEIEK